MNTFEVKDMTCGHCVGVITNAVKAVAPAADVRIDLATHRVTIDGAGVGQDRLGEVIKDAGYTPVVIDAIGTASTPAAPARGGCCCG